MTTDDSDMAVEQKWKINLHHHCQWMNKFSQILIKLIVVAVWLCVVVVSWVGGGGELLDPHYCRSNGFLVKCVNTKWNWHENFIFKSVVTNWLVSFNAKDSINKSNHNDFARINSFHVLSSIRGGFHVRLRFPSKQKTKKKKCRPSVRRSGARRDHWVGRNVPNTMKSVCTYDVRVTQFLNFHDKIHPTTW